MAIPHKKYREFLNDCFSAILEKASDKVWIITKTKTLFILFQKGSFMKLLKSNCFLLMSYGLSDSAFIELFKILQFYLFSFLSKYFSASSNTISL
jgi:hypothetical protein